MGLSICSLASGSAGNCIYVFSETTRILVDVGISVKRVEEAFAELYRREQPLKDGDEPKNVRELMERQSKGMSILVTHSHIDHIKYVPALSEKYNLEVYAHRKTAPSLRTSLIKGLHTFSTEDFFIGDITVSPFVVSHDVPCVGYSFYHQGKKLTVTTDLGRLDDELIDSIKDSDAVFIESNHDIELVRANPNYSSWLKKRITSDRGHLSNADCARAALRLAACRTKNIILGHLSEENNYPELAFSEVCSVLSQNGIREGLDVFIDVATQKNISRLIKIG